MAQTTNANLTSFCSESHEGTTTSLAPQFVQQILRYLVYAPYNFETTREIYTNSCHISLLVGSAHDEPEVSVSFLREQSGQARRAASSRYLHSRVADADEPSAVKRVAIAL